MAFGSRKTRRPTFNGQGPITGSDGLTRLWPIKRINILCSRPCNIAFFTLNTDDPDYPKFERYGQRGPIQDLGNPAGNMPMTGGGGGQGPSPERKMWNDANGDGYPDDIVPPGVVKKPAPNPDGGYWIDEDPDGDGDDHFWSGPIMPPPGVPQGPPLPPDPGAPWWEEYEPEYGDSLGGLVIPDMPLPGWRPSPPPWWGWPDNGDHSQHEIYCGFALTARKAAKMPSWWPSSDHWYDDSGRIGYRYWNDRGRYVCGAPSLGYGAGTYLQYTNDDDAGGQSNPYGETHGPNHLKPFVEIVIKWDTTLFADFFEISVELDSSGDVRGAFGIGWGF